MTYKEAIKQKSFWEKPFCLFRAEWDYMEGGVSSMSIRSLSERWGWSKSSVQRFIKNMPGTSSGTVVGTAKCTSVKECEVSLGHSLGHSLGQESRSGIIGVDARKCVFEKELIKYVIGQDPNGVKIQYKASMVREFCDYWTETNRTKTKMRFEMEKTWETHLRLSNWAKRNCDIDGKKNPAVENTEGKHYEEW